MTPACNWIFNPVALWPVLFSTSLNLSPFSVLICPAILLVHNHMGNQVLRTVDLQCSDIHSPVVGNTVGDKLIPLSFLPTSTLAKGRFSTGFCYCRVRFKEHPPFNTLQIQTFCNIFSVQGIIFVGDIVDC